eukprot:379174-Pelagomonas_calceolata.AAC.2
MDRKEPCCNQRTSLAFGGLPRERAIHIPLSASRSSHHISCNPSSRLMPKGGKGTLSCAMFITEQRCCQDA